MISVSVDTPCVQYLRENLKEILATLEISQGELAEKCGVSRVTINMILNAKVVPGLDIVGQIATALGIETERLVRAPENRPRRNLSKAS